MEFYEASTFLMGQFSSASCSLFEALYLCTSTRLLLLLTQTELILIGEESEIQDSILKIGKSILAMTIFYF